MRALIFALLLPLPAMADDHHLSQIGGLRAVHAWTRATSGDSTLVFVEIENRGDTTATLEGGESDIASDGGLVGFVLKDGNESWVAIPPVPVAPGRELHLEPGALAIRLDGLTRPLEQGDEFEMHIETSLGEMEVHVAVEASDATHHSHAGHSH